MLEPGSLVWEIDSLSVRLDSSVSQSDLLVLVLGSLLEVVGFFWVALGLAFSLGFFLLIMSRLGLLAGCLLVP